MTESIIFYALLTSQLVLMSFYFPRRIHQRMQTAFYTYTPDQYPRLYPKPASYYERLHQNYRLANQLLLILGCSVMMAMLAIDFDLSAKHAQMVPWAIFMIQMMPQLALELAEFKQLKLMRQSDQRTTRKAELSPRRLFDIVPRPLFTVTIIILTVSFVLDAFMNDFNIGFDTSTFYRWLILGLGNMGFALGAWWLIYARKKNPYQSGTERKLQARANISSMLYVSIGMSLFVVISETIDTYELVRLSPAAMSLYCQLIAMASLSTMLNTLRLDRLDFEVYREEPQSA
ncbi:MAG: hypothetical protein HOJ61_05880 [Gammaproteobacteria bacterium]|jgi:hypothetical protein|nr:hypothetical protein [Gammaproteobacteria bacterium]MBT5601745.1 hypothetical protein [Gammaproteobacteria bacterium]MBT6246094.1 hypothetical protein [Gammaproteobacteria bacterium]